MMSKYLQKSEINSIVKKCLPNKLKHTFPKIGYLYIIRSDTWPDNIYKFGKTFDYERRMYNYSSSNPDSPNTYYLILCTNIDELELRIKTEIAKNFRHKEVSNEWLYFPHDISIFIKEIENLIIIDPYLKQISDDCFNIPIYSLKSETYSSSPNMSDMSAAVQINQMETKRVDPDQNILTIQKKLEQNLEHNFLDRFTTKYGFSFLRPIPQSLKSLKNNPDFITNKFILDTMPKAKMLNKLNVESGEIEFLNDQESLGEVDIEEYID
jgi:hypothetical protein